MDSKKVQKNIVQIMCIKNNVVSFAKYQGHDLGIVYYEDPDNEFSFYKRSNKMGAKRWKEKIEQKALFEKVILIERVYKI